MELSREVKAKMVRELQQYWYNKKKLKRLENNIILESNRSEGQPSGGAISNTTEQKALKLLSTRSIIYCTERITYVENVINQLNSFEKKMFEKMFKDRCNWRYCETHYNLSKTSYYNIYNKCIRLLAEEWGEL